MFQNLFNMLHDGQLLTINLLRSGDKFIVGVLPQSPNVKDTAKSNIIPLNLKGTPEELDKEFLTVISEPLQRVSGILSNMEKFEKKADKAASESKALKEKTEKINKAIKEAEALEKDKPREALLAYRSILKDDNFNARVKDKIKALENKLSGASIFGEEELQTISCPTLENPPKLEDKNEQAETKIVMTPSTEQKQITVQVPITSVDKSQQNHNVSEQPVDMFAQAVTQKDTVKSNTETANPQDDPDMFAKFQAFMNMQKTMEQTAQ